MVQTVTIENVNDLVQVVKEFKYPIDRWLWFRGQGSASWQLLPRVWRERYSRQGERNLAISFLTRAKTRYAHCPDNDDYPGWLALMQHYGLPTRLLDWSKSPLVAAFFAVFDQNGCVQHLGQTGAAIWILDPIELNKCQGFESYVYPLSYYTPQDFIKSAFKELRDRNVPEKVIAVLPLEFDSRMTVQQGTFTVHSSTMPLDEIDGCENWLRKILIPAQSVPTIANELLLLGFGLADLFPDLGHLATELGMTIPASE